MFQLSWFNRIWKNWLFQWVCMSYMDWKRNCSVTRATLENLHNSKNGVETFFLRCLKIHKRGEEKNNAANTTFLWHRSINNNKCWMKTETLKRQTNPSMFRQSENKCVRNEISKYWNGKHENCRQLVETNVKNNYVKRLESTWKVKRFQLYNHKFVF